MSSFLRAKAIPNVPDTRISDGLGRLTIAGIHSMNVSDRPAVLSVRQAESVKVHKMAEDIYAPDARIEFRRFRSIDPGVQPKCARIFDWSSPLSGQLRLQVLPRYRVSLFTLHRKVSVGGTSLAPEDCSHSGNL